VVEGEKRMVETDGRDGKNGRDGKMLERMCRGRNRKVKDGYDEK